MLFVLDIPVNTVFPVESVLIDESDDIPGLKLARALLTQRRFPPGYHIANLRKANLWRYFLEGKSPIHTNQSMPFQACHWGLKIGEIWKHTLSSWLSAWQRSFSRGSSLWIVKPERSEVRVPMSRQSSLVNSPTVEEPSNPTTWKIKNTMCISIKLSLLWNCASS